MFKDFIFNIYIFKKLTMEKDKKNPQTLTLDEWNINE